MTALRAPVLLAMLITTGSGISAKQGRLRSGPGARRLTRKLVAGQRLLCPRLLCPRLLCPRALGRRPLRPGGRGPPAVCPVVGRRVAGRRPTARLVVPMVGAAGPTACYRVGTLGQGRRRLRRRLARLLLTCPPAAARGFPPNGRAMGIARRSPDFRSRARRGTRTPPLTRRPPRCRPAPHGQGRGGRGQPTAGHSPMATGSSPVTARLRQSRARHGRRQDRLRPGAAPGKRQDKVHRGQLRRGPVRRGSRRRSGLSGLPAAAGRNVPAVRLPPRSSAPPPRQQPQSRPRPSGRRQPSLRRQSSARGTTARLQAARPHAAGVGIPF
jgi:hypothetical protein